MLGDNFRVQPLQGMEAPQQEYMMWNRDSELPRR